MRARKRNYYEKRVLLRVLPRKWTRPGRRSWRVCGKWGLRGLDDRDRESRKMGLTIMGAGGLRKMGLKMLVLLLSIQFWGRFK